MGRNLRLIKAFIILNLLINSCKGHLKGICRLQEVRGGCQNFELRYRYDEEAEYCVTFLYSGCDGNDNNFKSLDKCVKTCVDEAVERCELPRDPGTCFHANQIRYYFNEDANQCQKFYFSGCQGNSNNFRTAKECQIECGGSPVVEETTTSAPYVQSWVEPSQSSWYSRGNDGSSRHSSGEVVYPNAQGNRGLSFRNNGGQNSGRQGRHNQYNQNHRNMGNSSPQHPPHSHHSRNSAYPPSNHGPQQPPHGHQRNSPTHGQGAMNNRHMGNLPPQHGPGPAPRMGMENHHSRRQMEPSKTRENNHRHNRPGQRNPSNHHPQRKTDSQRQRNFPDQQTRRHRQRARDQNNHRSRGPPDHDTNHYSQREPGPPQRGNVPNDPKRMSNAPPERNANNRPRFHDNRPNQPPHQKNSPPRNIPNSDYRNAHGGHHSSHGGIQERGPHGWNRGQGFLTTTPQTREWNNNWGDNNNPNTYTRRSNGWNQPNSDSQSQQDRWTPQRGPPPGNHWNSQNRYPQNNNQNSPQSRNSNQGNYRSNNWQQNGPDNNNAWGSNRPSHHNSPPSGQPNWQSQNRPPQDNGFRDTRNGPPNTQWENNNYHNSEPSRKGHRPSNNNAQEAEPRWNKQSSQDNYNGFNRQWGANKNWQSNQIQDPTQSTAGNTAEGPNSRNDGRQNNRDQHFSESMSFKRRRGRGRGRKRNQNLSEKGANKSPKWQRNRERPAQPPPDIVESVSKNSSAPIDSWSNHNSPHHEPRNKMQAKETVQPTSGHPQDWPMPHNTEHTNTGKWSNDPPQSSNSGHWSNSDIPKSNREPSSQWNANSANFNDNRDKTGKGQIRNKRPNSNGPAWDSPVERHSSGPEWLSNGNHNNVDKPNNRRNHNNKEWKNSDTRSSISPSPTPVWNTDTASQPYSEPPPMFEWLSSKDPEVPLNQNDRNGFKDNNFQSGGNAQNSQSSWRNSQSENVPPHLENFSTVEIIKKQRIKRPSENAIPTVSEPLSTFEPQNNSWAFDSNGAYVVPMGGPEITNSNYNNENNNNNNNHNNNNNIQNNNNDIHNNNNEVYPSSFYPSPTNSFPDFLNSRPERRAFEYEPRPTAEQQYANSNPNNIPNPPPKIDYRCQLPKNEGNCSGKQLVYYYNTHLKQCKIFPFTGCGGNGNKFFTRAECEHVCGVEILPICDQDRDPGTCRGHQIRYYFNKNTRRCEVFTYTGCEGNDNNFKTFDACQDTCSYIADILCSYPKDKGPCTDLTERFYYNSNTGRCESFRYGGCGGNKNNFLDLKSCRDRCSR